jgi:D-glycero-D-manno-heptose 1,7-bisphosphate phosphatase
MGSNLNKAIFLDRDGVIIKERGEYNFKSEHIEYVEGIEDALRFLALKGYLLIIITNQGGIALGLYDHPDVEAVHLLIKNHFIDHQVNLLDIYYCPHHPTISSCICRKPDILLFEKSMEFYHISPENSYFIGDQETDYEAGLKAGLRTILIPPNGDLRNFVHLID